LVSCGYKLVEDASMTHGRRSYLHDDDATRSYIANLAGILGKTGWERDPAKLRAFQHRTSADTIELEPGGSGTTGHFLHHMKACK
jgi:hypothetical protein